VDSVEISAGLRVAPGRHAPAPEVVASRQRERLLRSVIACSATRGYQHTTIADIVRRAGVSRSAFYAQFESKEECFLAAYALMADSMRAAVVASGDDVADWREALDLGIAAYFEWFRERPEVAAAFLVEIRFVGGAALAARARVIAAMTHRMKLLGLRARREQPDLPALEDVAYTSIIATLDELAHDYVRQGWTARLGELIAPSQYLARLIIARS
jgi:AcrR family transcriptional regulator